MFANGWRAMTKSLSRFDVADDGGPAWVAALLIAVIVTIPYWLVRGLI